MAVKKTDEKAVKSEAAKIAASKPAVKEEAKAPAKKAPAKKAPAKKAPAKKPAAKKTAAKTAEKCEVKVQCLGKEYDVAAVTEACKADFKAKNKGAVKSISVYIKPEESAAYYVVNGDVSDKVEL